MLKNVVLLNEVISSLSIVPDGVYIDGTFGSGGHSRAILSRLNYGGRLLAIDCDYSSVKIGKFIEKEDERFTMIYGRFSKLFKYMKNYNLHGKVHGILLDLGLSASQLNTPTRGFSFIHDGPLDMRMDIHCGLSASLWLRTASLEKIICVLKIFGEERFSRRIARSIVSYRKCKELTRTHELVKLIIDSIPSYDQHKHPATRTFQAIRIYINNELEELKKVLEDALSVLAPGGRLLVISFHSLEDRIVKNFIHQHSYGMYNLSEDKNSKNCSDELFFVNKNNIYLYGCYLKLIHKIFPSKEEIKNNISSRSAILRCVKKMMK